MPSPEIPESDIPDARIRTIDDAPLRSERDFVLYWMIAHRRTVWNYALDRAEEIARALEKPLVVLEALRCDYRWASDRLHAFVIGGMIDNARSFERNAVTYYPYVEPEKGAGSGLLRALADRSCCVVTDDAPFFFFPRMVAAAADAIDVRIEAIDGNGLVPLAAPDKAFARAYDFRRWIQREAQPFLTQQPRQRRLERDALPRLEAIPEAITDRWPLMTIDGDVDLTALPIDHDVGVVDRAAGGRTAGRQALRRFIDDRLDRYAEDRNHPDEAVTSELSPYLHFGHISAHEVFDRVVRSDGWTPAELSTTCDGRREGWWGASKDVEAFLDQLVTWRELGYNTCAKSEEYDEYASLPDWARETLDDHRGDRREDLYDLRALAASDTDDEIWNAAQTELRTTGRLHNYMRMVWGKKILEWTKTPEEALDAMIELNNRYGLDGRNPNSYSGITWVLGRYDRPWGPERPIYGKVRYMSTENTRKKLRLNDYLERYGGGAT